MKADLVPGREGKEHVHKNDFPVGDLGWCKCGARTRTKVMEGGVIKNIDNQEWVSREDILKSEQEERRKEELKPVLMLRERANGYAIVSYNKKGEGTDVRMIKWEEGGYGEAQKLYRKLVNTGQYKSDAKRREPSELMSGFTPLDRD